MSRHSLWLLPLFAVTGSAYGQMPYPLSLSQPAMPPLTTAYAQPAPMPNLVTDPRVGPAQALTPRLEPVPSGAPPWLPGASNAGQAAPPAATVNTVKFDPSGVQVQHQDHHWVLTSGSRVIKDFGNNERDAHDAAYLVRNMKLDELTRIGAPTPTMEYWLSKGEAPHLWLTAPHVLPLDPAHLRIQVDPQLGQWVLRNDARVFLAFGTRQDDARQALDVIQRYGFTHVIPVGQGVSTMLVFTANTANAFTALKPATPIQKPEMLQASFKEDMSQPPESAAPPLEPSLAPPPPLPALQALPMKPPQALSQQGPLMSPPASTSVPNSQSPAMTPVSAPVPTANCQIERSTFDYRQAEVRRSGNHYVLTVGTQVLGTFGDDEQAARRALNALHRHQLNELYRIGGPQSQFTYFLSSGRVPMGQTFGLYSYPLDYSSLTVRQDKQGWVLGSKDQDLWRFSQSAEAQQALSVIDRYKFDHVCHIGEGEGTGFTFLVRTR